MNHRALAPDSSRLRCHIKSFFKPPPRQEGGKDSVTFKLPASLWLPCNPIASRREGEPASQLLHHCRFATGKLLFLFARRLTPFQTAGSALYPGESRVSGWSSFTLH